MDNDNPAAKFREMSVAEVLERLAKGGVNRDNQDLAIWKITQLADQLEEAEQRIARMKVLNFDEANGPPYPIVDWREINRRAEAEYRESAPKPSGPNYVTVWTPQGFKTVPDFDAHLYPPLATVQQVDHLTKLVDLQGRQIELLRELCSCLRVVLSLHLSGGGTLLERAREITQNLEKLGVD